ncbi:MAG: hypothetical protein K2N80_08815 [Lachnospiraceae bacterium]|nr:hypothetical protein [Lachnospiraceae bacterium]
MWEKRSQPASTSYFFRQSYVDLGNIIKYAWRNNANKASEYGGHISNCFDEHGLWGIFQALFYIFATISMYVFGSIICAVISTLHIAALLTFNFAVYLFALTLRLFEQIYISIHKIFGACPYCKNHYKIPVYICSCGAEHTYLVPGKYGIVKRKCNCGRKMPTSVLTGRAKLRAKCPECGHLLDNSLGVQEAVPICVPVIGGPSVGKTCYITAVMKEMIEKVAPQTGISIQFYNQSNEIACKKMISLYNMGALQDKTSDLNPAAYNFFINNGKNGPQKLFYFYDIAGEAFTTSEALTTQKQYEYSHGFIFMVDPLSIPRVREKYGTDAMYDLYAASTADINETFDSFMRNLSTISGLSSKELSKIACAIVVNKIDAYDLSAKIGQKAIEKMLLLEENKKYTLETMMDMQVKQYLNSNGMSNFVKNVAMCFKHTRFYAVSSLGHIKNGQVFESNMVLAPFAWIVSRVDGDMRTVFKQYYEK